MSGEPTLRNTLEVTNVMRPGKEDRLLFVGEPDAFIDFCKKHKYQFQIVESLRDLPKYRGQDYTFIFFGLVRDPTYAWNGLTINLRDYRNEKGWYYCAKNILGEKPRHKLGDEPIERSSFLSLEERSEDGSQRKSKEFPFFSRGTKESPDRIPVFEELVMNLREENAGLRENVFELEIKFNGVTAENAKLQAILEESKAIELSLRAWNDDLQTQVSVLQSSSQSSASSAQELRRLRAELQQCADEKDEKVREITRLKRALGLSEKNYSDLAARLRRSNDSSSQAEVEYGRSLQDHNLEVEKLRSQIETLRETSAQAEETFQLGMMDLQAQIERLQTEKQSLTAERDATKNAYQLLHEDLKVLNETNVELDASFREILGKKLELEAQILSTKRGHENVFATYVKDCRNYEVQVAELKQRCTELEAQLQLEKSEMEGLDGDITSTLVSAKKILQAFGLSLMEDSIQSLEVCMHALKTALQCKSECPSEGSGRSYGGSVWTNASLDPEHLVKGKELDSPYASDAGSSDSSNASELDPENGCGFDDASSRTGYEDPSPQEAMPRVVGAEDGGDTLDPDATIAALLD